MEVLIVVAEGPVSLGIICGVFLDMTARSHVVGLKPVHVRFLLVVNDAGTSWLGNGLDIVLSSKTSLNKHVLFLTLYYENKR